MKPEKVLQHFKDTGALLEGHFELRSGLHSDKYFQCAIVLMYPRIAAELCQELAERVKVKMPELCKAEAVIAPAMGGIVVGHEIARGLGIKSIFAEKKDNALVLRRFEIKKGAKYVVAEDVITRGGRVQETVNIVKNGGGIVSAITVLVDRSGGKAKFDCPVYSLLEMEPVTYEPAKCPLCEKKIPAVHPGS